MTGSGAIRRVVPAIVAGMVLLTAPGAWGAIGPTDPGVVIGTGVHPSAVTDRSGVTHVVWATGPTLVASTQQDQVVYCRIAPGTTTCQDTRTLSLPSGCTKKEFRGGGGDHGSPTVMITPFNEVIVTTHAACASIPGDPGSGTLIPDARVMSIGSIKFFHGNIDWSLPHTNTHCGSRSRAACPQHSLG